MKARSTYTIVALALALSLFAPSLLRGQGPGGPPHPGPGSPASGSPGPPPPAAGAGGATSLNRPREGGQLHARPHAATPFGLAGRWWDDKSVIRAIGITRDQQRRMDSIFDGNKSAIVSSYKNFLKEQSHLESVNKDPHADQATTFAAIDAVNNARAALQKATAQMFLAIRHEMSTEQLEKLEKIH